MNGNDISRKGGEYESAKWFEVEQNRIILTAARPRALSRGILRRPEAGRGNESVTMHCIWNKTCPLVVLHCCVTSYNTLLLCYIVFRQTLMHQITRRSLTVSACGEPCRNLMWTNRPKNVMWTNRPKNLMWTNPPKKIDVDKSTNKLYAENPPNGVKICRKNTQQPCKCEWTCGRLRSGHHWLRPRYLKDY